ncbi:hypothetical protein KBY88_11820 [Cyanobium sp. Morenito 9A2]|nr:hypothetical protein [Cyanobium sp. Morenito 9A2]MCP9850488.1 hypothetical protein [Cyanobium sp. Morenito 9A2]
MHDIGKIGIPDRLLLKPGTVDPEERQRMESHVVDLGLSIIGKRLGGFALENLPAAHMLLAVVGGHHDMIDGSGCPPRPAGGADPPRVPHRRRGRRARRPHQPASLQAGLVRG